MISIQNGLRDFLLKIDTKNPRPLLKISDIRRLVSRHLLLHVYVNSISWVDKINKKDLQHVVSMHEWITR